MTTHERPPNHQSANLHEVPAIKLSKIEKFLKTPEARREIEELYKVLDESGAIVRTIRAQVIQTMRTKQPNIYSLFLHPDSSEGLTSEDLVKLYDHNPLVLMCMQKTNSKHMSGDNQAAGAYRDVLRLAMNTIRYEWLNGVYDELDPVWLERAERLGEYAGSEKQMHLQPGFNRTTTVSQPRRSTPSDKLPPR